MKITIFQFPVNHQTQWTIMKTMPCGFFQMACWKILPENQWLPYKNI